METLVTQSFGKEYEYRRAIFSIWSYWAHAGVGKVILFTDNPDFFTPYFKDQPVEYILLTPDKIRAMRGSIDFLHRMKIALIEEAFRTTNTNLLYVDSDTFFIDDPGKYLQEVAEKKSFMHLNEYRFDSLREMKLPAAKPFHAFLDLISSKSFTGAKGSALPVSPKQHSWNAGAMILHKSHAALLPDVYALTDQFYPTTLNHASEQYAFSIVLQTATQLQACEQAIYHYWYRVKKTIIDGVLTRILDKEFLTQSEQSRIHTVKKLTVSLPTIFETHVLTLRDNAIQAFHERRFAEGYGFALRALAKKPFAFQFLRDVFYHVRRQLNG